MVFIVGCLSHASLCCDSLHAWLAPKLEIRDDRRLVRPLRGQGPQLGHQGFDRFRTSVNAAPGEAERPPLVLPVPLVLVSCHTVQDYHQAAVAVRSCVRGCALLLNQRSLVAYADRHIVALVQHLFYEVLPLPQPPSRGMSACFWRNMPMYYETQASLVRELWHVVQYFLAASLQEAYLCWQLR
eukprot:s2799_g6.t1